MIVGLGSDLIDIRRIEATLERFGERFLDRVFTADERRRAERRAAVPAVRAATYAKRFAAKEACAKALGTGFHRGVFWRDIGVVNLPSGQPTLSLANGAARRLAELVPHGLRPAIHLTMTDDYPMAQAVVIISAEAAAGATSAEAP